MDDKKMNALIWEAKAGSLNKWRMTKQEKELQEAKRAMYIGLANGCVASRQQIPSRILEGIERHEPFND